MARQSLSVHFLNVANQTRRALQPLQPPHRSSDKEVKRDGMQPRAQMIELGDCSGAAAAVLLLLVVVMLLCCYC